jgi:sugar-specific transcriptional regulator TrmB
MTGTVLRAFQVKGRMSAQEIISNKLGDNKRTYDVLNGLAYAGAIQRMPSEKAYKYCGCSGDEVIDFDDLSDRLAEMRRQREEKRRELDQVCTEVDEAKLTRTWPI